MRPGFETRRFLLRPLCPDDAAWIAALNTDPEVMRFIPGGAKSSDEALSFAETAVFLDQRSRNFGYWAIRDRAGEEVHGWVALKKLNADDIEVGFRLRRQSWGRGIATETAERLLAYGFEDLELDRIVAVTLPGNTASQRVLAKLGLRPERRYTLDGFEWCYYAIAKTEWQAWKGSDRPLQ